MDDESIRIDFNNPLAPALTTEQEVNGAVAAFYPGVLERLHRMVEQLRYFYERKGNCQLYIKAMDVSLEGERDQELFFKTFSPI